MLCPLPGLLGGGNDVLIGVGARRRGGSCAGAWRGVGAGGLGSWVWASIVLCSGGFGAAAVTGADGVGGKGGAGWAMAGGWLRLARISRIILFWRAWASHCLFALSSLS